MERGQFTFYRSYFEALSSLPKKERLAAYEAIADYALNGTERPLTGSAATAFILVKPTLDSGRKKAENGKQGGSKREANAKQAASEKEKEKEKEIEKEIEIEIENECSLKETKEKSSRFSAPSVDEVRAYCTERRNAVDPQAFIDFYASKGWKVGNQPMKDWKAAVRTWEQRRRPEAPKSKNSFLIESIRRDYEQTGNKGMYLADVSIMDELQSTAD